MHLTCHLLKITNTSQKFTVYNFARQWAPKIWLHPQEKFFPWNVSRFLDEVTLMESKNCTNCVLQTFVPQKKMGAAEQFLVTTKNRGK